MRREVVALVGLGIAFYLLVAIFFFPPKDFPILSYHPGIREQFNFTNLIGYFCHSYLGWLSLILPVVFLYWIYLFYFYEEQISKIKLKVISLYLLIFSLSGFLKLLASRNQEFAFRLSGASGFFVAKLSEKYLGQAGSLIILFLLSLLSAIIVTELPLLSYLILFLKRLFLMLGKVSYGFLMSCYKIVKVRRKKPAKEERVRERKPFKEKALEKAPVIVKPKEERIVLPPIEKGPEVIKPKVREGYDFPPIDFLKQPLAQEGKEIKEDLKANAEILEETLRDFGLEAKVVNIERGPVITRYELQPAPGVKVQWIASLSEDIGLVMKSYNVHVAPIPGKGTIGVEVPNITTTLVYLREVITSKEFQSHPSLLALALGKKISGESLVADLSDMPHLLIAGTTGSGKTVCINALITSLLYRATPDELRLILIDPKMVELAPFNGLPHLVVPVVTEANAAIAVLEWAVEEMELRYKLFAKVGIRNIEAYNVKEDKEEDLPNYLPYIIIIIDELADLMVIASKEIEGYIARLAQLSRAVGIHMILATQRPSVDVITGVIKANFPSRISFKVASKVDSRTVLDMNGADKLLGKGDMLFIPPGTSKPIRAQGSLVSDDEIEKIVKFIKEQREPIYDQELMEMGGKAKGLKSSQTRDKLYQEAVNVVMQAGQASVSILQRRLGVGYTRAARLIDMMEEDGIVGAYQGSKPREILLDREEYLRNMSNIYNHQNRENKEDV